MIKLTILLLYIGAAALIIGALARPAPNASRGILNLGLVTGLLALLLHSGTLLQILAGERGLNLSLGNIVGLLAWELGVFAWIAAAWTRLRGLGALLFVLVGAASMFMAPAAAPAATSSSWQLQSHIVLSLLAYGLLTLAAALALLMRFQEKAIRRGASGPLLRLMPPLEAAEQGLFACIWLGFFLLSLAIFSGLIFVENLLAQHLVHKTVLSVLGWLVFATLLFGRWRFGWRGQTASAWTLGGVATLLLAYFGSRLILELILGRQWG